MPAVKLTKVEQAAIAAADLAVSGVHPATSWKLAAAAVFGNATTAVKACPRNAFLGLAEAGVIEGVPGGTYTRSALNKHYALMALKLLPSNPALAHAPDALWAHVMDGEAKQHNGQMHVVGALWRTGRLRPGAPAY